MKLKRYIIFLLLFLLYAPSFSSYFKTIETNSKNNYYYVEMPRQNYKNILIPIKKIISKEFKNRFIETLARLRFNYNYHSFFETFDKSPHINAHHSNSGYTPLLYAIGQNNLDLVKMLIQNGANVNLKSIKKCGISPLESALTQIQKNHAIVKTLVKNGADVNDISSFGNSMLYYAIKKKCIKSIQLLIEYGADIDYTNEDDQSTQGKSMLMKAITFENPLHIILMLIKNGADVNAENAFGDTPLTIASKKNKLAVISALIKNGADVNKISTYAYSGHKVTPLMWAISNNCIESVNLLIENGANIRAIYENTHIPSMYRIKNSSQKIITTIEKAYKKIITVAHNIYKENNQENLAYTHKNETPSWWLQIKNYVESTLLHDNNEKKIDTYNAFFTLVANQKRDEMIHALIHNHSNQLFCLHNIKTLLALGADLRTIFEVNIHHNKSHFCTLFDYAYSLQKKTILKLLYEEGVRPFSLSKDYKKIELFKKCLQSY